MGKEISGDADLQLDLMREHQAVAEAFAEIEGAYQPGWRTVAMAGGTYAAQAWDFVIAPAGAVVVLPPLATTDAGACARVARSAGTVTVRADGCSLNGSGSLASTGFFEFHWDGIGTWWRNA